jgi:hypothetical protein
VHQRPVTARQVHHGVVREDADDVVEAVCWICPRYNTHIHMVEKNTSIFAAPHMCFLFNCYTGLVQLTEI